MIFCYNCFSDTEIQNRIKSHANGGNCSVCRKNNSFIYNTESDDYLNGVFDKIINLYTPVSSISTGIPASKQTFLKNEMLNTWHIFNNLSDEQVYQITVELSPDLYKESPELFDTPIINTQFFDDSCLKENSILKGYSWEEFVNSLKFKNRFHTNYINTDILKIFCSYIRKPYKKGTRFYRGRISTEHGFLFEEMSAPKKNLVTDGRANSAGIRRLYLANDIPTTIHEVRAGAFDYVSVGCFELQQDITIVDFKLINQISPITENLNALQYLINREYLNKINDEMGKAMRQSDSPLDYIPTQYIADFIQSIMHDNKHEYDGIEYRSTLYPKGFNLAIFNPDLFTCISVEVHKIKELKYDTSQVLSGY